MSFIITLQPIPNQTLTTTLEGLRYQVTLKAASGIMAVTINRDGQRLFSGLRTVASIPLIPYRYLYPDTGNFIFDTGSDELPNWQEFGVTQTLIYVTAQELQGIRSGNR